jgi:hypothetical protein
MHTHIHNTHSHSLTHTASTTYTCTYQLLNVTGRQTPRARLLPRIVEVSLPTVSHMALAQLRVIQSLKSDRHLNRTKYLK